MNRRALLHSSVQQVQNELFAQPFNCYEEYGFAFSLRHYDHEDLTNRANEETIEFIKFTKKTYFSIEGTIA